MKQLALLVALLILLAPMPTLAGGDCKEPPNPPDDYHPLCPEFSWAVPYPYDFDPTHPPTLSVWDPNHPTMLPIGTANPVTIDTEPLTISVEGGVPPFTWELIDSPGFSLEFSTTQGHGNTLSAGPSACGTAQVRVTDSCPSGAQITNGYVKSVRGMFACTNNIITDLGTREDCALFAKEIPPCPYGQGFNCYIYATILETTMIPSPGCRQTEIIGNRRYDGQFYRICSSMSVMLTDPPTPLSRCSLDGPAFCPADSTGPYIVNVVVEISEWICAP